MNEEIELKLAQLDAHMARMTEVLEEGDLNHEQFLQATRIATALVILKAQLTSRGESK